MIDLSPQRQQGTLAGAAGLVIAKSKALSLQSKRDFHSSLYHFFAQLSHNERRVI
jgi:hypothetical protein